MPILLTLKHPIDCIADDISPQERERLAAIHQQIRIDMAVIRYGATEETVRDLEQKYKTRR